MQAKTIDAGVSNPPVKSRKFNKLLIVIPVLAAGIIAVGLGAFALLYPQKVKELGVDKYIPISSFLPSDVVGDKKSADKKKKAQTPSDVMSHAEYQALRLLKQRKEELDALQNQIKQKEDRLNFAEKSLDNKMSELKKLRAEISRIYDQEKKTQDERLQTITKAVFVNMKPEQSAPILSKMEVDLVLRMMSLVPESQISKVLVRMDQDKAANLSSAYAKYKKNLPKLSESVASPVATNSSAVGGQPAQSQNPPSVTTAVESTPTKEPSEPSTTPSSSTANPTNAGGKS